MTPANLRSCRHHAKQVRCKRQVRGKITPQTPLCFRCNRRFVLEDEFDDANTACDVINVPRKKKKARMHEETENVSGLNRDQGPTSAYTM